MEEKVYYVHGFTIKSFDSPIEMDGTTYRYYVALPGKKSIKFNGLSDAKKWCRDHCLEGILRGWIK